MAEVFPVVVAGGGPVGLTLALELGLRGVRCLLAEKRDGALPVPKMSQVSARNMELCRRWGIAEKVRNRVWSPHYPLDFVYLTSLTGRELGRHRMPSYAERGDLPFTPEGSCHCPQNFFDPIVAETVRAQPSVTLRYNLGIAGFRQDESGVEIELADSDTGARETVRAQYLVGCDGPGGMVRRTLGIALGGLGAIANSVNIYFRSPALAGLHDKGWARFYRLIDSTGCWAELIPIDGRELWRLTVFDHAGGEPDSAAYLRRMAGRDFPFEVISAMRWERRDFVAEDYGRGRVFIAGDAAHECSPTGGLGMHTGVEEAANLAWKLAARIQGWGGTRLLDSYAAERRPIALRNVALATRSFHEIAGIAGVAALDRDGPAGEAARERFRAGHAELRRYSVPEHVKTQYCYEGSPVCVSDGTPAPPDAPPDYVPSARPGTRAPHVWIGDGRSTLDLFGGGFVLLRLGREPPNARPLEEAAKARGVPFHVTDLVHPETERVYGRRLVLVRPDGHVAWRADDMPADPAALIDRVRGA